MGYVLYDVSKRVRPAATYFSIPISDVERTARIPYSGRHRPQLVDRRILRWWKSLCLQQHGEKCDNRFSGPAHTWLQLIDVRNRCIFKSTEACQYVALSYVWGQTQALQLSKANKIELQKPGSLSPGLLSTTQNDAIDVSLALGEQYLWIDSLCITQDDEKEKLEVISCMDSIYGHAVVTIVAASGNDANAGLPGIHKLRHRMQRPFVVNDVILSQTKDPVTRGQSYLGDCTWMTRGWTFQERLFSKRVLIFTSDQVYWECRKGSWCEDSHWEYQERPSIHRHVLNSTENMPWNMGDDLEYVHGNDLDFVYIELAEEYLKRSLSHQSDILNAFQGILRALERETKHPYFWALPTSKLGPALAWTTGEKKVERLAGVEILLNVDETPTVSRLPSWSWISWTGNVLGGVGYHGFHHRSSLGPPFYRLKCDGTPIIVSEDDHASNSSDFIVKREDIPVSALSTKLLPAILCFWTEVATLEVTFFEEPQPYGEPKLGVDVRYQGRGIEGSYWRHPPKGKPGETFTADFAAICGYRVDPLSRYLGPEVIMTLCLQWEDGVAYRRGACNFVIRKWRSVSGGRKLVILA